MSRGTAGGPARRPFRQLSVGPRQRDVEDRRHAAPDIHLGLGRDLAVRPHELDVRGQRKRDPDEPLPEVREVARVRAVGTEVVRVDRKEQRVVRLRLRRAAAPAARRNARLRSPGRAGSGPNPCGSRHTRGRSLSRPWSLRSSNARRPRATGPPRPSPSSSSRSGACFARAPLSRRRCVRQGRLPGVRLLPRRAGRGGGARGSHAQRTDDEEDGGGLSLSGHGTSLLKEVNVNGPRI